MTVALPAADSYYLPLGDGRYQPTVHVQGAWQEHEQHMAPVSGLIVHAIDGHEPRGEGSARHLGKIDFDILGVIPAEPTTMQVTTLRPGRTIELIEATAIVGDRPVVRARAWRLAHHDSASVAGGREALPRLPAPDGLPTWAGTRVWPGGYIASLQARAPRTNVPGRGQVWLRTDITLVDGEPVSPTAAFIGLVDTANGIVVREDPRVWMFPNVDLSVHLFREPTSPWVGLDTSVVFSDDGIGLTTSTLHDIDGPVGRSEQLLTVRPLRHSPG